MTVMETKAMLTGSLIIGITLFGEKSKIKDKFSGVYCLFFSLRR